MGVAYTQWCRPRPDVDEKRVSRAHLRLKRNASALSFASPPRWAQEPETEPAPAKSPTRSCRPPRDRSKKGRVPEGTRLLEGNVQLIAYRTILRARTPPPTSNVPAPTANNGAPPVSGRTAALAVGLALTVTFFLGQTVALGVTVFLYWNCPATVVVKLLRHTFTVSRSMPATLAMFAASASAIAAALAPRTR